MYKMCEKNGKNGILMRKKNFVYYLLVFLRRYKIRETAAYALSHENTA